MKEIDSISDVSIEDAAPNTTYVKHPLSSLKDTEKPLRAAAIIAGILVVVAIVYAIIRHYSVATVDVNLRYSAPIENTKAYYYPTDGSVIGTKDNSVDSPEGVAYELSILFMEDLKAKDKSRTFRITEYEDLTVKATPTTQLDAETAATYFLQDNEVSEHTWLVEISVRYKYEGVMSPVGPSNNEWIDVLYQSSPVGFLMTRNGNQYLLRSRYR